MKVAYENTTEYKILQKVNASRDATFLRKEFSSLPGESERQISRGLAALVKKNVLARLGRGVYAKLQPSRYRQGEYLLPGGFIEIARQALTKMGIPWRISQFEQLYNEGRSTQVPIRPVTIIEKRFRRHLSFKNREFLFESSSRNR